MLRPLLILIFLLLMGGAAYVLFCTQFVDRILLRMRLGKRAESLENTAAAIDETVKHTVSDLRKEKDAVEKALAAANSIHARPLSQTVRTIETHPYVIRSVEKDDTEGDYLYWSNTLGWTKLQHADRYDLEETRVYSLPIGGRWLRQRAKKFYTP